MRSTVLRNAVLAAIATAGFAAAAAAGEITIYKQPGFSGQAATVRDNHSSLAGLGFQNQISSVVIDSGRWELCSQPNFQGDCVTLGPGRYASVDPKVYHRTESMREVTPVASVEKRERYAGNRERYADNRERYADNSGNWRWRNDRYGGTPAIELYGGRDFRGPAVSFDDDADSLGDKGVSSIAINEGTWQICTRPGFEGRCRTLGPGEYRDLGRFDNMVGSVKRIG